MAFNVSRISKMAVAAALALASAAPAWGANYLRTNNPNSTLKCSAGTTASTLNVTETTPVIDLDVGLVMTRTFREDMRFTLSAPNGGPTVTLATGPAPNQSLSNYNIRISDEASYNINTGAHNNANDNTAAPFYRDLVRPDQFPTNALSAFDGINPNGTWTLRYCDNFPNGTITTAVNRFELIFQGPGVDLALDLGASTTNPGPSSQITITADVDNSGSSPATGVTTQINLPPNLSFISSSGDGSYNSATGVWTIGTVPTGTTQSLNIVVDVLGDGTVTGEIATSAPSDVDSTPGNGSTTEDDDDTVTITVTNGVAPSFICSIGDGTPNVLDFTTTLQSTQFDWPAGSLATQTYPLTGETKPLEMQIGLSGNTNRFINRDFAGSILPTPVTDPQMTGGSTAGNTEGILMNVDYESYAEFVTIGFELYPRDDGAGASNIGMEKVQIPIYDVDLGTWTDRIEARGFFDGNPVTPIYTTSASNVANATGVTGTGGSANTSGNGNMWVTFLSPVDTVEFDYLNVADPAAQPNPIAQVISIENIRFCELPEPMLEAEKVVETVPAGEFMIPGTQVQYAITITNDSADGATGPASAVDVSDVLPDNLRFLSATTSGFTGGSFTNPALPATNTDCDGGACHISFEGASLALNGTGTVTITAEVK